MASTFIDSLPNVRRGVLSPSDQKCILCHETYGTQPSARGIIERPIKLPCSHIVGSECITTWLSGHGNNCPICRHEFFPRQAPSVSDYHEDEEIDNDDGTDGYEILSADDFRPSPVEWYLRNRRTTPPLSTPPDFTRQLPDHSSRRRTEQKTYLRFVSRHPTSHYNEHNTSELQPKQLDELFAYYEANGAFDEIWGRYGKGRTGPSRRQMWDLLRDMGFSFGPTCGGVQDEEGGRWQRTVWCPRDPRVGGRPWWWGMNLW